MKKKSSSKDSGSDIKNSAIELASAGLTMEKAEECLMMTKGALKKLAIRSADFSKRFLNAELTCCIEIEKALVRKARGYDTTEITEVYVPIYSEDIPENSIPKLKLKEVKHVKKYIPPDNTAAVSLSVNLFITAKARTGFTSILLERWVHIELQNAGTDSCLI